MEHLNDLLAFVRAAEARSFTQASRLLGVTPSGVGKSVARLEAALGVRLLQRTTRRVGLTDDGAVFFEHCRRILDELAAAQSQMSRRGAAPRGRLRVSLPTTLGRRVLAPQMPRFLERHPEITIELGLSDRRVNLIEDGIDVAVRIGALDDSRLVARRLGDQQVVTVVSPRYLGGDRIDTIGELALHRCIVFRLPTTGRERPWHFRQDGRPIEWRPRAWITADEGETLVELARAGAGVTQVPSYFTDEALARGELVEILAALRPHPDPIHAVFASQRNLPARTRAFVDFLASLPGWKVAPPVATARARARPGARRRAKP